VDRPCGGSLPSRNTGQIQIQYSPAADRSASYRDSLVSAGRSGTQRARDLLLRRCPRGRPVSFDSVRDLGSAPMLWVSGPSATSPAAEARRIPQRAKQRANGARLPAMPTDSRRQSPQVNGPSGHVRRRRNTQKIWFASRRPGVRVPLAPRIFRTPVPHVQQRRTATCGYSASSGSSASGELRASLSRLSAASVALSGTMV
jgi:hypothetical protein